ERVAAAGGRSVGVGEAGAVRRVRPWVRPGPAFLFRPRWAVRWRTEPSRGSPFGGGSRRFVGEDPPRGTRIYYALGKKADKIALKVMDFTGAVGPELRAEGAPGLHGVNWDLTRVSVRAFGP